MKYIDVNTNHLENRMKGFSKQLKSDLKDFFASFAAQEAINAKNFDKLYKDWSNNLGYWSSSCLTCILLAAEIDPMPYLTALPAACFDNVGVTRLDIPFSIKKIDTNAFNDDSPIVVTYEGTKEQFKNIHHLWSYDKKLIVHCQDGEVKV